MLFGRVDELVMVRERLGCGLRDQDVYFSLDRIQCDVVVGCIRCTVLLLVFIGLGIGVGGPRTRS
jgi:hypothetical protein